MKPRFAEGGPQRNAKQRARFAVREKEKERKKVEGKEESFEFFERSSAPLRFCLVSAERSSRLDRFISRQ